MRYHWGLGVGHLHAHQVAAKSGAHNLHKSSQDIQTELEPSDYEAEESLGQNENNCSAQQHSEGNGNIGNSESDSESDLDDPELTLEERDFDGWDDLDSEDSTGEVGDDSDSEDSIDEED